MIDNNTNSATQKLLEAFVKIKRLHRTEGSVDDLRHSEIFVLFCIKKSKGSEHEGIKLSEISSRMKVSNPTTTQVINRLVDKGYVERCVDKEDRRVVRITLTQKGEEVIIKAQNSFNSFFEGLASYLGEEKSSLLAELLDEVYKYYDNKKK